MKSPWEIGILGKRGGKDGEDMKCADSLISFLCNTTRAVKGLLYNKGQMMEGSEPTYSSNKPQW